VSLPIRETEKSTFVYEYAINNSVAMQQSAKTSFYVKKIENGLLTHPFEGKKAGTSKQNRRHVMNASMRLRLPGHVPPNVPGNKSAGEGTFDLQESYAAARKSSSADFYGYHAV
jgi:hypothetical protein